MGRKKENVEIQENNEIQVNVEIQDTFNNDSLELLNDEDVVIENIFESKVDEDGKENN